MLLTLARIAKKPATRRALLARLKPRHVGRIGEGWLLLEVLDAGPAAPTRQAVLDRLAQYPARAADAEDLAPILDALFTRGGADAAPAARAIAAKLGDQGLCAALLGKTRIENYRKFVDLMEDPQCRAQLSLHGGPEIRAYLEQKTQADRVRDAQNLDQAMQAALEATSSAIKGEVLRMVGPHQALHWLLRHEDGSAAGHGLQVMAVNRLDWKADGEVLDMLAQHGAWDGLRIAAIAKVADRDILRQIVESNAAPPVRQAACGRLGHQLSGCECTRCGKVLHDVKWCRCTRCGKDMHDWDGCVCRRCGKERHQWQQLPPDPAQCNMYHCDKAATGVDNQSFSCPGNPGGPCLSAPEAPDRYRCGVCGATKP